jgi:hypothetical protein
MSTKGNLTRAQAVAIVGEPTVDRLDSENCDFTGRALADGDVEFSASVTAGKRTLTAYYYQTRSDVAALSWDDMEWEVQGYEII